MKNTKLLVTALSLLALAGCTKAIPYKELPPEMKEHSVSKSLIDLNSEYLYSSSTQSVSRMAEDARPFASSDNKRIKFEIDEFNLRVIETERDARFSYNKNNNKLILEIPISHTEFRCAKDRFGECTNTEENDTLVPWNQRSGIKVKLEAVKSGELELLPLANSKTFGDGCYSQISSRLISSKIEADAINFQIERTFQTNLECFPATAESISDGTITAVFHYSFVKLNTVLTPGFKTISYPEGSKDEQTFGFFSTKRMELDVDNRRTEKGIIQIMNRWNPDRKEIVYHLSDEFAKPENKSLKDMTYVAVDSLNKGLADANVKFRIKLQDPSGKVPGDIRNSMIVLVDDPVASGLLGYGPQTEDPVTGEIISARTIMFSGVMKQFVRMTYDEVAREKARLKANALKATTPTVKVAAALTSQVANLKKQGSVALAVAELDKISTAINTNSARSSLSSAKTAAVPSQSLKAKNDLLMPVKAKQITNAIRNYAANVNADVVGLDAKAQFKYLAEAKNCSFAPAMQVNSSVISAKILNMFPGEMKPWIELSEKEKSDIVDKLLPEMWVTTLIHELGHNLGLRHNFAGSEDKVNYYSAEELAAQGVDREVHASSVMDYVNDLKGLPGLGKYDIAALRFGYNREVELTSPAGVEVKTLPTTLKDFVAQNPSVTLKDYQYCTDEHVGINAGCKRFDFGSSYTEIVQNYIKDYEEGYATRNFKNGRASFSLTGDIGYAYWIDSYFREMRVMLEVRERLKYRFGLADDAQEWTTIPWLKDLNDAALLGGAYMTKVLLEPDLTCAVALATDPNTITQLVPLAQIDPDAVSCFKIDLNEKYVVVGQTGKAFNSVKSADNTNAYVDQIDVRGIWPDKLMAARNLFSRQTGIYNFDKEHLDNFANLDGLRGPIADIVYGLMQDNVTGSLKFTLANGIVQEIEVPYTMYQSQIISTPLIPYFGKWFGINQKAPTELQEILATKFVQGMDDKTGRHEGDRGLSRAFSLKRYDEATSLDSSANALVYNGVRYVAETGNIFAAEVFDNIKMYQVINKMTDQAFQAIYSLKKAGQPLPEGVPAEAQAIYDLPIEKMEAVLTGEIKDASYYVRLLQILPNNP